MCVAFSCSGQRCTAVKVVYVIEKDGEVSKQLVPLILDGVRNLKVASMLRVLTYAYVC